MDTTIPPYITAKTASYQQLKENARRMRTNPTEAESILWKFLRGKQLGYPFRRQLIIDDYIVDFVCLAKKLIIEVDGKYHSTNEQQELDDIRENKLLLEGYRIIRFTNEEVMLNIKQTIECIKKHLI